MNYIVVPVEGGRCPVCGRKLTELDREWGECLECGVHLDFGGDNMSELFSLTIHALNRWKERVGENIGKMEEMLRKAIIYGQILERKYKGEVERLVQYKGVWFVLKFDGEWIVTTCGIGNIPLSWQTDLNTNRRMIKEVEGW